MKIENHLREYINLLIEQPARLRLKRDLTNVTMILTMDKDAHVPDTLTRVRVLPSVAVVGQREPVNRGGGRTVLEIYVKFLPGTSNTYESVKSIGKVIKGLPGVRIVKITAVGGRPVTYKGSPIVI